MGFETLDKNHNTTKNSQDNELASKWGVSDEFMNNLRKDREAQERLEQEKIAGCVGNTAMKGLGETEGDVIESFAPLALVLMPTSPVALGITADVVTVGSPYDKKREELKKAA